MGRFWFRHSGIAPPRRTPRATIVALCFCLSCAADAGESPSHSVVPEDAVEKPAVEHWSFQPIRRPTPPAVDSSRIANPIDAFVAARLSGAGLELSPPADRRTLIRRVYLDMLGLLPSPGRIEAFVNDPRPNAHERLVDEVLASPHYGERWGRHWLDVVRFAESNGFETNHERPNAYRYRDYVIGALNEDKPYDRFVFEQLAGDAVGEDAATGFLVGGAHDVVKSPDPVLTAMQRQDELADMINTTGTAFLGLTLGCARCHDHKFDPVTQRDYYSLQAVFAGVQHGERPLRTPQSEEKRRRADALAERIAAIDERLRKIVQAQPSYGRTLLIDDETIEGRATPGAGVALLAEMRGHGRNPKGTDRGHEDDPGDTRRLPNVSGGRYTWWINTAGQDVLAYAPKVEGQYRVWLSWGCGWETHTQDARYLIDGDGNAETQNDQREIARIDQQNFADGSGEPVGRPLWSGFYDAGVHEFQPSSRILLRCGETGTAITADAVVLQQANGGPAPAQPRLRGPVKSRKNLERFAPVRARSLRFTVFCTNSGLEPCIDELEIWSTARDGQPAANVALATRGAQASSSGNYQGNPKHRLEHINDGRYGNGRSWISNERGGGWVQIELAEPAVIDRVVWGRDREQHYRDRLATRYKIEVAAEREKWETVASSDDRVPLESAGDHLAWQLINLPSKSRTQAEALVAERKELESERQGLLTAPMAYAGRFQQPGPTHRLYRGDPMAPREQLAPDAVAALGSLDLAADAAEQQRRVALANWIVAPDHPLTARVLVNRLWHYHFGHGLVSTPSDFGAMGARPSHPELLDWLAGELVGPQTGGSRRWSIKHIHRLILLSATYRQSSRPNPMGLQRDAQTKLLWRFPPRRLEAEAIRDNILLVSGALDRRMTGSGFLMFHLNDNYSRNWIARDKFGPPEFRRMVHALKLRMEQDSVFGAFDCPDGGQVAPRRSRSTTPIQSLNLLNSEFIVDQARCFAERVRREAGGNAVAQVQRIYLLAFGRRPDEEELADAIRLVEAHGLEPLCRAVYNANEFLFLR